MNKSLRSKNSILLFNGNMKTPVRMNKSRYLVSNTYAFDSVSTWIKMAITDRKYYHNYVLKSTNEFLVFCKDLAFKGTNMNTHIKTQATEKFFRIHLCMRLNKRSFKKLFKCYHLYNYKY